ncbi:MAG TPA: DUF4097 family beta strand repeat-containing protein [Thermoleophilaceae bacterium]|nr:DUF4097 family beta strand repeat-containing protein [Thermoleophilaceae bacterium]
MAAPVDHRTSRPVRLLLFAVGSLLTLAMIAWGGAQALDRLSIEEEQVFESHAGVKSIDLRYSHGNVDLVPARGRRVEVAIESRHGFFSSHQREDELRDGRLRLRGSCDFVTFGTCEENYRVAVPRGVAVAVRTSGGETFARGLRGNLKLWSNAGSVRAVDVRGRRIELGSHAGGVSGESVRARTLTLDSRAGGIDLVRSVARRVDAKAAAGSVDVELLRPPLNLDAESQAGSVTVLVPDVGYAVVAQTSAGEESVRVRQLPNSRRKVRAQSRAGNVSVLPLERASEPARSRERDRARAERARSRR